MSRSVWCRWGCVFLLAAAAWWGLRALGVTWVDLNPRHVRTRVLAFGAWAPAIYLLVFGQPVVPLPASILLIAAGLAFGPVWGAALALLGALTRAYAQFGLARWVIGDRLARRLKGRLAAFSHAIVEHGFHAVLLVRLVPGVPFDMQNYGFGLSRVRFGPYALATLLGLLPGVVAFAILGDSLIDAHQRWKLGIALVLIAVPIAAHPIMTAHAQKKSQTTQKNTPNAQRAGA